MTLEDFMTVRTVTAPPRPAPKGVVIRQAQTRRVVGVVTDQGVQSGRLDYFPQGVPDVLRESWLNFKAVSDMGDQAPALMVLELYNALRQADQFAAGAALDIPTLEEWAKTSGRHTSRARASAPST